MKRIFFVIILTFIILNFVFLVVFTQGETQKITPQNSSNTNEQQENSLQYSQEITSSELPIHNTQQDCWIAYEGKVYDITAWLPKHPGSAQAIAPYCGTSSEFEVAFTQQHGTSKVQKLMQEGIYKGDLK